MGSNCSPYLDSGCAPTPHPLMLSPSTYIYIYIYIFQLINYHIVVQFESKVPDASSISTECESRSSSIHSSVAFVSHSHKGRSYKEALEHAKDANEVDLHIPSREVTQGIGIIDTLSIGC